MGNSNSPCFVLEDVITDYPDKKSIMMYVMCYFQVLSQPKVVIEDATQTKQSSAEESDVRLVVFFFFNYTEHIEPG
jgi:hypothetical protein